jgi:signal transduction histidine kinase
MPDRTTLYRDVIECMTSGVAAYETVRDPGTGEIIDFRWVLSNAYAEKVVGKPEAELLGKTLLQELPEHGPSGLFERYRDVVETGQPIEFTYDYHDGRVHGVFLIRAVKLGDGFAVAFTDITPEAAQRRAYQRLADRFAIATRAAQIGVWEHDLETDAISWDDVSYKIYGLDPLEPITIDRWRQTIHPADVGRLTEIMERARRTEPDRAIAPLSSRFRVIRADDEIRHLQAHAQLVVTGEHRRLVGVMWDVTEEVEAAREFEKKKVEAEAANVAKSQFLAVMSHEIRTPLNGIMAMASMLEQTSITDVQRKMLKIIRTSGEDLLEVLDSVLDISRIEAGRMEIDRALFDLDELVSRAKALFTPLAREKGVAFRVETSERARGTLFGDATRIRQLLYNLLSNAVKFTLQGEVALSVDLEQVAGRRRIERDLVLTVRDTGVGVPADQLERIFEPFTQVDSSSTRRFGGVGLGLSIAAQLAEIHGGSVTVQSEVGVGSTFTARVRVSTTQERAAGAA